MAQIVMDEGVVCPAQLECGENPSLFLVARGDSHSKVLADEQVAAGIRELALGDRLAGAVAEDGVMIVSANGLADRVEDAVVQLVHVEDCAMHGALDLVGRGIGRIGLKPAPERGSGEPELCGTLSES